MWGLPHLALEALLMREGWMVILVRQEEPEPDVTV